MRSFSQTEEEKPGDAGEHPVLWTGTEQN